jgi:hypothetical protein
MKSATTGAVSGCIVWAILFIVIGSCLLPVGFMIGGFSDQSDLAIRTVAPFICPHGTNPQLYSYQTQSTDDNGFPIEATAYELHCLDTNGNIVKTDAIEFGFLWEGIAAGFALVITVVIAFVLAAPAGVLISRMLKPKQKSAA